MIEVAENKTLTSLTWIGVPMTTSDTYPWTWFYPVNVLLVATQGYPQLW